MRSAPIGSNCSGTVPSCELDGNRHARRSRARRSALSHELLLRLVVTTRAAHSALRRRGDERRPNGHRLVRASRRCVRTHGAEVRAARARRTWPDRSLALRLYARRRRCWVRSGRADEAQRSGARGRPCSRDRAADQHAARAGRRRVGLAAAGRRIGREQRGRRSPTTTASPSSTRSWSARSGSRSPPRSTSSAGPVRRLVLTHAHVDHVGGTRAFPMASVLGSPQTSELLDGEMPVDGLQVVHARVRKGVRRARRARHPAGDPSRHRRRPRSRRASRCCPRPGTPRAT